MTSPAKNTFRQPFPGVVTDFRPLSSIEHSTSSTRNGIGWPCEDKKLLSFLFIPPACSRPVR